MSLNLWLVSPAWRRFDVTRLALAERRWLCDELAARGLTARGVIVADDENLELAAEYGFDALDFPNDRGLGAKFNAGFDYALARGADYIIHVGSDDWLHPDFFVGLPELDERRVPVIVAAGRIAVVHLPSGLGFVQEADRRWGVIPWAIPRHAFVSPEPVEPGISRGVELSLTQRLARHDFQLHDPHAYVSVDFKSEVNVTPYAQVAHLGEQRPLWDELAKHYPAELVELARTTSN